MESWGFFEKVRLGNPVIEYHFEDLRPRVGLSLGGDVCLKLAEANRAIKHEIPGASFWEYSDYLLSPKITRSFASR